MIWTESEEHRRRVCCVACASLAGTVAVLVAWSWAAGVSDLLSFDSHQLPMAPLTALVFLLLTGVLLAVLYRPDSRRIRATAYAVAIVAAATGLLALLRTWLGWGSPLEQWLVRDAIQTGRIPLGQMSPVTGAFFLGMAVTLLLRLPPQGRRMQARWGATLVACVLVGLVVAAIASHCAGQPWALGTPRIPLAFPTALTFYFLGLALLTLPPPSGLPAPGAASRPPSAPFPWRLPLGLAVLMGLFLGALSAAYLRHEQALRRAEAWQLINSIGDLKAAQILHWRTDHWNDIHYLAGEPAVARDVQEFLQHPEAAAARAAVLHWFSPLQADAQFSLIALFDTNAVPRLTVPERPDGPPVLTPDLVAAMARERRLLITDLHFGPATNHIHLDLVFPVFATTNAPAAGYVMLQLDPGPFLFPLLQSWPTASRTAETLLVRREGATVLYLNELRHLTNTALKLRLPLDARSRVPAAMAAMGRTGVVEGVDYRGEAVLAAIRPIAGSHWCLITKMDHAELLAPLWRQAWLTLLLTLALTGLAGIALGLVRKQREVRLIRGDLALERERLALAARVELLMKSANDIILIVNDRWRIIEANDRAVEAYGYPLHALQQLPLCDLRPAGLRAGFARENAPLETSGHVTFETIHQRKNGTTFPVEVSARKIEIGGGACVMGIVRDISERKAHEREIARWTRLYATLSQINQCIVRVTTREKLFREVCRITTVYSGFRLAWIGWLDPVTREVVPVGSAGDDQVYLTKIKVSADDRPEGQGPAGICIREGRTCIFNNFVEDPRALPWREAALAHGLRSVAALPLRRGGAVCGAFLVYADEPDVFQDKERTLLEEAAVDISFALDHVAQAEQRQQTEAALRFSEEKFSRAFANNAAALALTRLDDGLFLEVNDTWVTLSGYSRVEALGHPARSMSIWPSCEEAARFVNELRDKGAVRGWVQQFHKKSGEVYVAELSAQVLTIRGEQVVLSTLVDITARKQTEAALRQAEEKYRGIFEHAVDGIYQSTPEGALLSANPAMAAIHGYASAEELIAGVRDIAAQLYVDAARRAEFKRLLDEHGEVLGLEHEVLRKDGRLIWVSTSARAVRDARGRILFYEGTVADITARKQAEETLRENEERYRSLFENMLNGFAYCRVLYEAGQPHDFVYLAVNKAFETQTGLQDVVGKKVSEAIPGILEADPDLIVTYARVATTGRPESFEVYVEALQMWFAISVYSPHKDHFVAVFDVVTERKRLEAEREVTVRLLSLLNAPNNLHELMRLVTLLLHDWSGCEAVGIRLHQGEDYPYFETRGFPAEFVRLENHLCECDAAGELLHDASGQPALACMCGNVLRGRFDASQPFFTTRGSFWSNDTTRLLATTTAADRQANTRNRCNAEGYESVALVALRTGTGAATYGLLQVNDKRRNRFTPERIALLERLADSIAIGIAHRQDQARLRESEEKYRRLVDNAGEMIYVAQDGIIRFANRRCAQLTGLSEAELLGKASADFVVPEELVHVTQHQQRLARGENPAGSEEFRVRFRDGAEHWLSVSSVQIQREDRPATLNFATDITTRKRTEEALQLQGAALAAAANAIVITDTQGTIEWANPAFSTFTGYTLAEAQGRNPRELVKSGQHAAAFYQELWDTIRAGRVWRGEMINRRKDGALYTEDMTVTPLRDAAGGITHYIAIKQDITERKTLEAHLLRNQRLESVGRLASGIAHDLNNILAPVMLAPPLLREALRDPQALKLVDTIEASVQRGAEIIKQLLTFGRGLKGERIPLQLRTLVREMVKLMRETFPKDIDVQTRIPAEVSLVTGDATQLHQILMNLCVNARDAMPAGGELTLTLEPVTLDAAAAAATPEARAGRYVVLTVGDSGTGIAPENLDKIFDPFFTTKPLGEGTGLGLSTVLGIVRSHAGFVQVQSAPGQGTRFRVFLPVSEKAGPAAVATQAAPALPQGHGELVLVVDDEEHLRKMVRRFLESNGYRVSEAQDGADALQALERMREPPQVLVTDLMMPRMDGPTLIRTLRQQRSGLKLIALGGLPPPPAVMKELGLSPQNFIAKPFSSAALLTALHRVLA